MQKKQRITVYSIIFSFAIVYSLISIVNHYLLRTFALDLGAYTNALFDYINFQWNDSTVFKEAPENLLADHFDLYLIIFSPLSLILGSYTLIVVQIASILFGGIGVYRYVAELNPQKAITAMFGFFLFFGVFSALSFDYHSNVVAAMLIPWLFYYLRKNQFWKTGIVFFLILIAKENMSLWMFFVSLGLLIEYRKNRKKLLLIGGFAIFAIAYFIAITQIVMPAISNNGVFPHFKYSVLGNSYSNAILFMITHPVKTLDLIFFNHLGDPTVDFVKSELHILVLISGLYLLFFRPAFILMLIPVYFQKLFHDNPSMWGINGQYSIEFAPIIIIGAFTTIHSIKSKRLSKLATYVLLLGILISTVRIMDNTHAFTNKERIRIYQGKHYSRKYNVSAVKKEFRSIPKDAIVSAQSPFVPQLALRDKIYQFPIIKDATYIVVSKRENTYPVSKEKFQQLIDSIEQSKEWEPEQEIEGVQIFKKISK